MDISRIIALLRSEVKAAQEELNLAISFHEAWKPAAFDADLHARMGESFATNTFLIVRSALRREMLLALARLWDRSSDAVGMKSIADKLRDNHVLGTLAAECEAYWISQPTYHCGDAEDFSPEMQAAIDDLVRQDAMRFAREQSASLRCAATEAICVVDSYARGGSKHAVLRHLQTLRNERLAHRQIKQAKAATSATDVEIEAYFQDTCLVVHKFLLSVENVYYDQNEVAEVRRKHAEMFWRGLRGERTEGHPDYKPLAKISD